MALLINKKALGEDNSLFGLDTQSLEEKLWRKSHSFRTITTFRSLLKTFKRFISETNILLNGDPYIVLDKFAGWLDDQGYRPTTIKSCLSIIKRLFTHNGISISADQLKEKVETPKTKPFQDSPLELETARRIILACDNDALKLTLLLMKDTLGRPSEVISLRLGDFDLSHDPPFLTIPAYSAKGDIAREAFFTYETKSVLMDYLKNRGIRKPDQFLFLTEENLDPIGDEKGFQIAVKKGLNAIENAWSYMMSKPAFQELRKIVQQRGKMRRYDIHMYSFRKYGFTKIADTLGPLAAHAIAGHEEYLITYYRKSRAEREKDYRKVMPKLCLFTPSEDEKLREQAASLIRELPREALLEILRIGKKALKE